MFTFVLRGQLVDELKSACQVSPSIISRIEEMGNNPLSKANKTDIPVVGEYYVNAGRHCILFDVDFDNEKIELRSVVQNVLLHKILTGKIAVPERLIKLEAE